MYNLSYIPSRGTCNNDSRYSTCNGFFLLYCMTKSCTGR